MSGIVPILVLPLTALLSCLLTWVAMNYARRAGMLDRPGMRRSHHSITPRGGGLGIILAALFSILISLIWAGSGAESWVLLGGVLCLAVIGWLDDHHPVSAWLRLLLQCLIAFAVLMVLPQPTGWPGLALTGLLFVSIVWVINLYNFMDGSDGMAATQAIFVFVVLCGLFYGAGDSTLAWLSAAFAAAAAGFLVWNWPPAKVFMGDVSSGPLGFMVAYLLVVGLHQGSLTWPAVILVSALFFADSTYTLINRVISGERWYTPHKQHAYQLLIERGWSHKRTLLLYLGINGGMVLPATLVAQRNTRIGWILTILVYAALLIGWFVMYRSAQKCARKK